MITTIGRKHLVSLLSILALTILMALPTSAAQVDVSGGKFHIQNTNTSLYLNLDGSGDAYKNRNVNVYGWTSDDDQYWYIEDRGNGVKVYTAKNGADANGYTLNMNTSTYNCNIYPDVSDNNGDSQVETKGNQNNFSINLLRDNDYELAVASQNNVMWGGPYTYYWKVVY